MSSDTDFGMNPNKFHLFRMHFDVKLSQGEEHQDSGDNSYDN